MSRIYIVTDKAGQKRLVRATNVAQARNHVARDTLSCEVASQDDLVVVISAGGKVESTRVETEGDPA